MMLEGANQASEEATDQMGDLVGRIGAGEEIRTLDPNLGKVMLYP